MLNDLLSPDIKNIGNNNDHNSASVDTVKNVGNNNDHNTVDTVKDVDVKNVDIIKANHDNKGQNGNSGSGNNGGKPCQKCTPLEQVKGSVCQ